MKIGSEDAEQTAFVEYLETLKTQRKILLFTAIPQNVNNVQFGMRNKRLGVRPGFPDLVIITGKGILLFIEMKAKKGRVSIEQKEWMKILEHFSKDVRGFVSYGYEEAKQIVDRFI